MKAVGLSRRKTGDVNQPQNYQEPEQSDLCSYVAIDQTAVYLNRASVKEPGLLSNCHLPPSE